MLVSGKDGDQTWPLRSFSNHQQVFSHCSSSDEDNTLGALYPIGSMYAIYGNIYHQYIPNVSIYTIHGSYGYLKVHDGNMLD